MIDQRKLMLQIAEYVREVATRQGNVPFKTGDLRKSIIVAEVTDDSAIVGSNLPYARAVHDGRPAITIRPKRKQALFWPGAKHPVRQVEQPARKGRPFLADAVAQAGREGLPPMITKSLETDVVKALEQALQQPIILKL